MLAGFPEGINVSMAGNRDLRTHGHPDHRVGKLRLKEEGCQD